MSWEQEQLVHRSLVMPLPAEWLMTAVDQLDALRAVCANWDSYGADRPQPHIVDAAERLLNELGRLHNLPRPAISPTRTGGVLLEWKAGARELEIELLSADASSFLYADGETGDEIEGQLRADNLDEPTFVDSVRRLCE